MADSQAAAGAFVGRTKQLASISSCVADAEAGKPWVIWIEGDAGHGKSALLRRAISLFLERFHVIRAQADELATDVPFELSSQLGAAPTGSPFTVGIDLLRSWAQRGDRGPVAVVIEDLHWADTASRQALLTAVQRLDEDRIVVLITSRPGVDEGWNRFKFDDGKCRRIQMEPWSTDEVEAVSGSAGVMLTQGEAERLREHTRGHPLYVQMLLAELSPAQLRAPKGALPAPRSLAMTTVATLAKQSESARSLAFALAVVNQPLLLNVAGDIAGIDRPVEAFENLLAINLVQWHLDGEETSVEFTHPLFRAAIYEDLPPTRRRDLHRAAIPYLGGEAALAHRVLAATEPDAILFSELTDTARHEMVRGAAGLAARSLLWAASVSPDPLGSEQSLLRAARLLLADNQVARVEVLVQRIERCRDSDLRNLVLGLLEWRLGHASEAERRWLSITSTARPEPAEPDTLADALTQLGSLYAVQSRPNEAIAVSTRALAGPLDDAMERVAWNALALGEGMLHGAPAGIECLGERLAQAPEHVFGADVDLLVTRGLLGFYAGHANAAVADMRGAINLARQGSVSLSLPRCHLQLSVLLINLGAWDEAMVNARTALSLVTEGHQFWMQAQIFAALATLHGYRGTWGLAEESVAQATAAALRQDTSEAIFTARIARAALARARERPGEIVHALGDLVAAPALIPMFSSLAWWPTLIDAMLDCAHVDEAEAQIHELQAAAAVRRIEFSARIAGLSARVSAARQCPDEATTGFSLALDLAGADFPFLDRALLHQSFGRHLRAIGNRKAALGQLRNAHQLLSNVGAHPFLERVEADLTGSGLRASARSKRSVLDLTEREQDVAALVAKGLTNRETATELYISEKSVEYHLRNVFAKLGISKRTELRQRSRSNAGE
jgi:DNA-binding CsgD family transcriptional regulator